MREHNCNHGLFTRPEASGTTNALPGGTYTVFAQYAGDGTFGSSSSTPPISVTVNPEASAMQLAYELLDPTTGAVTNPNATTAVFGTPALLRVNVTSAAGDACAKNAQGDTGCPTGTVILSDNGSSLGNFALNSLGYTEDSVIDLPGGMHSISASYPGDGSYSAPNPNPAIDALTISPAETSIAASTYGATTVTSGFDVSFYAILSAQNIFSNIFPTGTVSFFNGTTALGSVSFEACGENSPGTKTACANFDTSALPHGKSSITARYSGDGNYASSTSSAQVITVLYPTTTTIAASNTTSLQGQNVTFTAQVNGEQAATAITGTVQFVANGPATEVICNSVALSPTGQATCTTSALQAGFDYVYASYSGDSNYAASGSTQEVAETVNPALTLSAYPGTINIAAPGQSGTTTVTFAAENGFSSDGNATLTVTCSGLPAESSCSISPAMINIATNGTGTAMLTVTTTAASAAIPGEGKRPMIGRGPNWQPMAAAILLLLSSVIAFGFRRRQRRCGLALAFVALMFVFANAGCGGGNGGGGGGGGGNPGTPPGTTSFSASFTVNGVTQALPLTLDVQ